MEPKQIEQIKLVSNNTEEISDCATLAEGDRIQIIKEEMVSNGINLTAEDLEGLKSYLATKKKWEQVYRRLADS